MVIRIITAAMSSEACQGALEVLVSPRPEQAEPEKEVEQGFERLGRHEGSANAQDPGLVGGADVRGRGRQPLGYRVGMTAVHPGA